MSVVERYCGAGSFLTSLGDSLQVYLENLAASFPNQQNLESSELYTFIQVSSTLSCLAGHLYLHDQMQIVVNVLAPAGCAVQPALKLVCLKCAMMLVKI